MAAEIGMVRQNSYNNYSEGQERVARLNRRGELVIADFWTQMIFDGRTFHMQIGTEDAPVDGTAAIDDLLVWMVADNPAGHVMIPAFYQVNAATFQTATLPNVMLEVDRLLNRYSSGGTAFVPENLRTDRPRVAVGGSFVVGTDITTAAKTAVPGSIELWRHTGSEDVTTTSTGNENRNVANYNARVNPFAVIVGVGSVCLHNGSVTSDIGCYGTFDFVQLPEESVT